MSRQEPTRSDGIALVVVLWMLALLSVIAGSLVFSSRTEVLIAGNLASLARAEAAADGGVHKAIHELVTRPQTDLQRWKGDGVTHRWQFGEAELQVTILDESAKIDINLASDVLLRGLFRSLGVDEAKADALADTVLDWRDADDLRRLHGAEKDDYTYAGKDYGPPNQPFETIEELRLVLGMNDELYRKVAPLVTVYSGQPGINSTVAPRGVLLALPGATPELVDPYLEQRRTEREQGLPIQPLALAQGFASGANGSVFSIQVAAILRDNARFFREAVVRSNGTAKDPVTFLAWRAPMEFPNTAAVAIATDSN